MPRFTLVAAVVLVMFTHAVFAEGAGDKPKKDRPLSEKEMRSLVKALVSPNHAPEVGTYPDPSIERIGVTPGCGRARSSAVEHYLDMVGVTGSIPVVSTTFLF